MQSVSTKIWTSVAVSISCDDNHYTTGTSFLFIHLFFVSCSLFFYQIIYKLHIFYSYVKIYDQYVFINEIKLIYKQHYFF